MKSVMWTVFWFSIFLPSMALFWLVTGEINWPVILATLVFSVAVMFLANYVLPTDEDDKFDEHDSENQ